MLRNLKGRSSFQALSVGIFPYVLKLLQTTTPELRQILVFIWTKILALDKVIYCVLRIFVSLFGLSGGLMYYSLFAHYLIRDVRCLSFRCSLYFLENNLCFCRF